MTSSNQGAMLGKNRHLFRQQGFWCNCIHCKDTEHAGGTGKLRSADKRSWKRDIKDDLIG